ncbi:hypothetical protein Tco_0169323 [Tanacetum coccineum]
MEEVSLTTDEAKLKKMADEMLRQRCTSGDEHQYHIDQMKNFLKIHCLKSIKEYSCLPHPRKTTPLVQKSCQRDPEDPVLSLINQDLLYLKKGSSGPEKIVPQKVNETNDLSNTVTSNSVPTPQESKVVKNDNVIQPGMFRIKAFKASRVKNFVPDKHVKASFRTKSITISQPRVITKNDVNSKTNGFSPTYVKSTTRIRKPQPRNNPKNDKKHISSECNNIKLAIRNAKSEFVCAMCKKCLITANRDVCVLNYVNDMNSRALNKKAHVSNVENQKKHRPKVWKPKKVGSKERLASPKTSTPRSCLRWSPTGRLFDLKGTIITTSKSVCQSDCSKGDNACTSNP